MDITAMAALVFGVAAPGVTGFQVALALGAPWGAYAMGGAFQERFPPGLRVAAVVQAAAIALSAVMIAYVPLSTHSRAILRIRAWVARIAGRSCPSVSPPVETRSFADGRRLPTRNH